MRLGFDLDGTIADLHAALAREASRLFPAVDPASLPRSATGAETSSNEANGASETPLVSVGSLTSRQQSELWRVVCDQHNFWETLEEIEPGSLERLFRLVHANRWELIFLTSRPGTRGDSVQAQSHRWLTAHGYLTPSVFVVSGSRGKIAASLTLDVVVDDRPENCLDVTIDSSARAILVWRGDEGKVPGSARQLGIGAVSSIGECLDILESLDRPDGGTRMVDRLKRLLGLKPQAARLSPSGRSEGESPSEARTKGFGSTP